MFRWLFAKRWRWISALVILIALILLNNWYHSRPEVEVAAAEYGPLELTIAASGEVDGVASDLGFKVGGNLLELYVEEGDPVFAEQSLARLDPGPIGVPVGGAIDVITAPYDGWVVKFYARPGAAVQQGMPVIRVVRRGQRWVTGYIDSEDADYLRRGQTFTCRAGGYLARPWPLRVAQIGHEAIPRDEVPGAAKQVRVRFDVTAAEFGLMPGTPVDLDGDVPMLDRALLIPAAAVVRENGDSFVWVVTAETVEKREVVTGANNFRQIAISEGLREGERIVVEGKTELTDGQRVRTIAYQRAET